MRKVLSGLKNEQITKVNIDENWTVKDILAHLCGWNKEYVREIKRILLNKAVWWKNQYDDQLIEDKFNERQVIKMKEKSLGEILVEWEKSFRVLIKMVKNLSEEEWLHQSGKNIWRDKSRVTVSSLFDYEYLKTDHESGHVKQIKKFLVKSHSDDTWNSLKSVSCSGKISQAHLW